MEGDRGRGKRWKVYKNKEKEREWKTEKVPGDELGETKKHRQARQRERRVERKNCRLCYYLGETRERQRERNEMVGNNRLSVLSPRACTVKAGDVIIHTRAASLTKTLLSFKLPVHNVLLMDSTYTNITICINGRLWTLTNTICCSRPVLALAFITTSKMFLWKVQNLLHKQFLSWQKITTFPQNPISTGLCCDELNPELLHLQFFSLTTDILPNHHNLGGATGWC